MTGVLRAACIILLAAALAGCLGGRGPSERFLRLDVPALADCPGPDAGATLRVVAMRGVTSLPGLERRTVLFEENDVLSSSPDLYWEGAPPELVDQYLDFTLGCSGQFRTIRPFVPRGGQDMALGGRLLAFEVERGPAPRFVLSLRLTVTDGRGQNLLAARLFEITRPLEALDAKHIAAAGNAALAALGVQVRDWLAILP